jgi:hypothetical protein
MFAIAIIVVSLIGAPNINLTGRVHHDLSLFPTAHAQSPAAMMPNDSGYDPTIGSQEGNFPQFLGLVDAAIKAGNHGVQAVVVVLDAGYYSHPDLDANVLTGMNVVFVNGTNANNHGEIVTYLIGGVTNNVIGGASIGGYSGNVKVVVVRVIDDSGNVDSAASTKGVQYALTLKRQGVNVVAVNCSWGGAGSSTQEQADMQSLTDNGIMVFAAAGKPTSGHNHCPACYGDIGGNTRVVPVAQLNDTADALPFSWSWGAFAAPQAFVALDPNNPNAMTGVGGVSATTPQLAALYAVLRSFFPNLTPDQTLQAIKSSADPITGLTYGKMNVTAAWNAAVKASTANAIDDPSFFVKQQYVDFLNRQPDSSGLAFWTNNITQCGADTQCTEVQRINTSAAFFLSIEFQQTGYLVYKTYKASFGNMPNAPVPIKRAEFLPDTLEIGNGVVVNQGNWQQQLETNKQAYFAEFVQRSRFASAFPTSLSPPQFVDALFANAGVTPSSSDRTLAITEFGGVATTTDLSARARALRRVAENSLLDAAEKNRAFVLMQYFGYLQRDPNAAPNTDFSGYTFWLNKLNSFNGNFIQAEMVKAFISSTEYRQRFGQ